MTTAEDIVERLVIDEEHFGNRKALEWMEQGVRYLSKEDNEKNKIAFSYFMNAAEIGDAQAQYYIGYFYERGIGVEQDIEQAVHYYTLAANNGWGAAVNALSHMKKRYRTGNGVHQNLRLAECWDDQPWSSEWNALESGERGLRSYHV